jgi:hypothetical protein
MLPHSYKKVGAWLLGLSFLALVILKINMGELGIYRTALKQLMLVGLLFMAISKEEIEDEMIVNLRAQAFSLSFICGIIYALVQPYINYGVAAVVAPEKAIYEEFGTFIILWFMLTVHLLFFYVLKKAR